jgi:nucleoside-diphosphate-sugar epimerase
MVEASFKSDPSLPATIVRLPMVYGPGDPARRTYAWLKRMDDGRKVIPLEEPLARWRGPMGYVEDAGRAIAIAAINDSAAGRVYNVAEPDVSSTAEFIREIGEAAGWSGHVTELPAGALPNPWSEYHLEQHVLTDSNRIRRELGYRETMPRAEALRRTIEWERANPPDPLPRVMFDYLAEDRALEHYTAIARTGGS